jgi:PhnB protein
MAVKPIPDGYHTVTPYLVVPDARRLLEFVKQAFGAEVKFEMAGPGGGIAHAEFRIGDSMIMCGQSGPDHAPFPAMLHLYVPNADAIFGQAVAAGATVVRPIADQFYGDRTGGVKDPFGNQWWVATHIEDVSMEEMKRRMAAMGK